MQFGIQTLPTKEENEHYTKLLNKKLKEKTSTIEKIIQKWEAYDSVP